MQLRPPSEELKRAIEELWKRGARYISEPTSSLDLSWTDLSGMELDLDLEDCNLTHARCRGTRFGILMVRCRADEADFSQASFKKAQIAESTFDGAIFHGALMLKASVAESTFHTADFTGANLSQALFFRCDLRGARFTSTRLPQVGFDQSLLAGADFTGCEGWVDPDRVNVGSPDEPRWIEGSELANWLRAAGATDVRVGHEARASG